MKSYLSRTNQKIGTSHIAQAATRNARSARLPTDEKHAVLDDELRRRYEVPLLSLTLPTLRIQFNL